MTPDEVLADYRNHDFRDGHLPTGLPRRLLVVAFDDADLIELGPQQSFIASIRTARILAAAAPLIGWPACALSHASKVQPVCERTFTGIRRSHDPTSRDDLRDIIELFPT
jgi:hypothetical protein